MRQLKLPSPKSAAAPVLFQLIDGARLSRAAPNNHFDGKRLSALIHELRRLGWLINDFWVTDQQTKYRNKSYGLAPCLTEELNRRPELLRQLAELKQIPTHKKSA